MEETRNQNFDKNVDTVPNYCDSIKSSSEKNGEPDSHLAVH